MMHARHLAVLPLVLGLSAPAYAHDEQPLPPSVTPAFHPLLGGIVRQDDMSRLFDYLRSAVIEAAEGREPPAPPAELGRRAEEIARELEARGALAAVLLLSLLEDQARRAFGEGLPPQRPPLPPLVPYTRVSD